MTILGIETSCDETSAAILEKDNGKIKLRSNVISSSLPLHAKTGGIIPENAAREQLKLVIPVINQAMVSPFDAIAVTVGPGLMGSLLVGVETAKTLSMVWNKPIIPVNHLIGHIYANWIGNKKIDFPAIGLIVSGGHTDLILMKKHGSIVWLGGTRDDAAGEAFDKIGRLLGLPYPAGPIIEKLSKKGNPKAFNFPRPMLHGDFSAKGGPASGWDFSFSGLKAAVLREVQKVKQLNNQTISDICASVQEAIVDVLVRKTINAAQKFKVKSILLGGGVAANQKLHDELNSSLITNHSSFKLFVPPKSLCTDNAAMIAAAAFYNCRPVQFNKISANPQLYFE